jgi:hypothetical protein
MGFVWFFYVLLWFSYWFRHISEPLPLRTTAQGAQVSRSRPLGCSGRSFRDWRITRLLNLRSFVRRVWLWHGEFMRVYPSTIWVSSWLYVNPQFWWIFSRVLQFRKVIYTKTYTNGFDHFNKWHLTNKTGDYLGSKNTQHLYQVVFLNDDFTKKVSEPTQHIEVTSNLKGFFCHKTWSFTMFYPPRLRFKDHKNRFFTISRHHGDFDMGIIRGISASMDESSQRRKWHQVGVSACIYPPVNNTSCMMVW